MFDLVGPRAKRRLGAIVLGFALAAPAWAHGTTAGDLPVTPETVRVSHRPAVEIVALFASERLPNADTLRTLRGARAGNPEALLPAGIDGVLRNRQPADELVVAGFKDLGAVEDCIRVLDAPMENAGAGKQRVTLTLDRASAPALRVEARALPGSGRVTAEGKQLTLEGSPEWLHRALRQVIRAELNLRPVSGAPSS
jgi:hypothetical protein